MHKIASRLTFIAEIKGLFKIFCHDGKKNRIIIRLKSTLLSERIDPNIYYKKRKDSKQKQNQFVSL